MVKNKMLNKRPYLRSVVDLSKMLCVGDLDYLKRESYEAVNFELSLSRQVEHLAGETQSVVFFIPFFFQKKTFRVEQSA